jgi:phosphate transport system substrate-binding protein
LKFHQFYSKISFLRLWVRIQGKGGTMRYCTCITAGPLALISMLGCLAVSTPSQAGETIRIGGTGSVLAAMRILGNELRKVEPDTQIEVLASLGTSGGIEALAEGVIDVGLAARRLKPDEIAKGVSEAACMTTALVFAANHPDQGVRHP